MSADDEIGGINDGEEEGGVAKKEEGFTRLAARLPLVLGSGLSWRGKRGVDDEGKGGDGIWRVGMGEGMILGVCEDKGSSAGDGWCCPIFAAFEVLPIFTAVCPKHSSWVEKDIKNKKMYVTNILLLKNKQNINGHPTRRAHKRPLGKKEEQIRALFNQHSAIYAY